MFTHYQPFLNPPASLETSTKPPRNARASIVAVPVASPWVYRCARWPQCGPVKNDEGKLAGEWRCNGDIVASSG